MRYRLADPTVCDDASEAPGIYTVENMWSPRRNHRAATLGERMFVFGGRAREIADIPRDRTVGGLLVPRIETDPFYSTWREPSVLKNDVWASDDEGGTWVLVNPGCHAPQAEDVLAGNPDNGKAGVPSNECSEDDDCYGVGECRDVGGAGRHTTCVCPMWSPRELHAAAVHDGNIYVVGGFVSVRRSNCGDYACGDVDAGAYRGYKSDVWRSSDGATWTPVTLEAEWPGRGDHGMFIYSDAMYIVGGAADGGDGRVSFMNDIWRSSLPERYIYRTRCCCACLFYFPSYSPACFAVDQYLCLLRSSAKQTGNTMRQALQDFAVLTLLPPTSLQTRRSGGEMPNHESYR